MADDTRWPPGLGKTMLLIIAIGILIGALIGTFREQLGGSAAVTGGLAGLVTGGIASVLMRRRASALKRDSRQ